MRVRGSLAQGRTIWDSAPRPSPSYRLRVRDQRNLGLAFEETAARFAEGIAVREGSRPLSYAELAVRVRVGASRLAHLPGAGDSPRVVAILAAHGVASLTGFLTVLRAGCVAAVLPADGLETVLRARLQHAGADVILHDAGHSELAERIGNGSTTLMAIEEMAGAAPPGDGLPPVGQSADRPALLIYTSGSTGEPRGVVHSHASILQNVDYHGESLKVDSRDVATWSASLSTISGVTDSLRILLRGGTLCPLDLQSVPLAALPDWLRESGATITHLVPTVFRRMLQDVQPRVFSSIRILHLGGEPVTRGDFELFRRHFSGECRFLNNLGCSEVPSFRQSLLGRDDTWDGDIVPLRSAVPGKDVVLIDSEGCEIEPGRDTPGEIAVDTRHAALGFWRDDEQTARAFVRQPDGRVRFRTGDIGQWQAGGELVHLGRSDRSLKVAGRWVNLASIEATFQRLPEVAEVVVVAATAGPTVRLTAFCACPVAADATSLRARAAEWLEPWQVPGRIVLCDELPTLANGKLDRRELKKRAERDATAALASNTPALAASSYTEQQLIPLWERVLSAPGSVHVESSFTQHGGDSLAATELTFLIEREFGIEVPQALVFETQSLREFAEAIDELSRSSSVSEYLYWKPPPEGGNPVLCVGDHHPLTSIVEHFGRAACVAHLRLDGLQTRKFRRLSIEAQVDAYWAELRAAHIEQPRGIVGFSYGGLLALALAAAIERDTGTAPPLLLLEPSVPGHPAPDWADNSRRERLRVWLDSLRGRWRNAPNPTWETYRWLVWRNTERFAPTRFAGVATLVGSADYLARWGQEWERWLPSNTARGSGSAGGSVEHITVDATDHQAIVAAEHAQPWLGVVAGWLAR